MAAVGPSTSSSYFSYLNPILFINGLCDIYAAVVRAVAPIFQNPPARALPQAIAPSPSSMALVPVPRPLSDDWTLLDPFMALLDESSRPYTTLINGWKVPKTWKSDFERAGQPDRFVMNGTNCKEITSTVAQLHTLAGGEDDLVQHWTQLWSYRTKIALMNEFMKEFKTRFGLNPVLGRNGYKDVIISLDTQNQKVTCEIKGEIYQGTDEEIDLKDIRVDYTASVTYNISTGKHQFSFDFKKS